MSGSVNKVILIGNVGKDPEVRQSADGRKIVNLTLATSDTWKDKSGAKQEKTEWHRIVIFNQGLADVAERYVKKGSKLYVEGALQTRKWTDKGVEKYTTEVVLSGFNGELSILDFADNKSGAKEIPVKTPAPASNNFYSDEIPF